MINDWLVALAIIIAWLNGLWLGWHLWRRPLLKYEEIKDDN